LHMPGTAHFCAPVTVTRCSLCEDRRRIAESLSAEAHFFEPTTIMSHSSHEVHCFVLHQTAKYCRMTSAVFWFCCRRRRQYFNHPIQYLRGTSAKTPSTGGLPPRPICTGERPSNCAVERHRSSRELEILES